MLRVAFTALTLTLVLAAGSNVAFGGPRALPLSARVIEQGEFPGFGPFGGPKDRTLFKNAKQWIAGDTSYSPTQASAELAGLRREGFTATLVEQLTQYWGGVSWVMQLGSAASARSELAANVTHYESTNKPPQATYTAFPVNTIPGAHGYLLGGTSGGFEGDNIVFHDGPFLYLVGNGWKRGMTSTPSRSALIAAATRLYKRVHGHPAP